MSDLCYLRKPRVCCYYWRYLRLNSSRPNSVTFTYASGDFNCSKAVDSWWRNRLLSTKRNCDFNYYRTRSLRKCNIFSRVAVCTRRISLVIMGPSPPTWTCSLLTPIPPSHAHTHIHTPCVSIGKRALGHQLKGFLVHLLLRENKIVVKCHNGPKALTCQHLEPW